jgi:exodeoxyribonuclease VII large subunit
VVTGIGHETDFTIADFVADARAPTPTAAAELVSPERAELRAQLAQVRSQLRRGMRRGLEDHMQKLDYLQRRLLHPGERIAERQRHLTHLASRFAGAYKQAAQERAWSVRSLAQRFTAARPDLRGFERSTQENVRRLGDALQRMLERAQSRVARAEAHIQSLNPQLMLERGYSITETAAGGIVRDAAVLSVCEEVRVTFAKGAVQAAVKSKG